jgi:membrane-bound serine protease (ClpP class)
VRYIEIELNALHTFFEPNIALLFTVIGAFAIYAEFCSPGMIFPGVAGASLTLLGLASLAAQPLSPEGLLLTALAFALLAAEPLLRTRGIATAAATLALLFGLTLLIDSSDPARRIHLGVAAAAALPFGPVTGFLLSTAARARRNKRIPLDMLRVRESESQS